MQELKRLRELTKTLVAKDELLKEQTRSWKYILNSLPESVFISSLDGDVTFINNELRSRLEDRGLASVKALSCFEKLMTACLEGQPQSLGEIEVPKLGGWYEHTVSIIYDDAGNPIGYICVLRDIQEKKVAEMKLRKSEEQFRNVSQSAVDAIIIANEKGHIVSWNKSAEKMFGYPEEEIIDKPLVMIMPKKYREKHLSKFNQILKTDFDKGYVGKTVKLEGLNKDGSVFPIELVVSYWKTDEGMFFSGIIRNLTEKVRDISVEI